MDICICIHIHMNVYIYMCIYYVYISIYTDVRHDTEGEEARENDTNDQKTT
jgi:Ca2+/Na+ antiporter